jgi:DNA (cytosine-5)-methyltransferase 1
MSVTAIDLFSGAGGLTIGFKRAGIETIAALEKNTDAVETYGSHSPEVEQICENIINADLSRFRGSVDLVYGGPPCQPFSTGGLRKGDGDARNMIPAFLESVALLKPVAVFMENVPGLLVKSRLHYLNGIVNALSSLGFSVSWRVLNSADYGVPQKRRRLFVVGIRGRQYWFPRPLYGPGTPRPHVPSGSIISDEPIGEPPSCPVVYAKYPDLRPSPYAGHVYNGGGRPIDLSAPCHTILASAGGYKTHWVDTLDTAIDYHRHLRSGGNPREGEVPGARRLSVEESALIQTFPSDLKFAGSRSSRYTQVGDAVPPVLAEVLGRELLEQLNGVVPDEFSHQVPQPFQQPLWA